MNPYTARAMIKNPVAFVGRVGELQDLYTLLGAMQCCSIVGPRRIGKSSLLYHLADPPTYSAGLPEPEPYVFAFLDLQELAGLGPDDLLCTIVERLGRASEGRLEVDPEQDGTLSGFRRFLMRATDAGLRLVVGCDEFEMLSQNPNFDADFFAYLRGLCSNYDLALVTSSRDSLFDLCHQGDLQTSQFWNIFVERTLGLMPEEEALTLIREPFSRAGGSISDEEATFVLELAGRQPFFIQVACYHLFEAKTDGGPVDLTAIEGQFLDEARHHYEYGWNRLEASERRLLIDLLSGEGQAMEAADFRSLSRKVLVTGSAESPALVSSGWRQFIEGRAELVSAAGSVEGAGAPGRLVTPTDTDSLTPETIFISYSRSDWDEFVNPLVTRLRAEGFSVWVDQHLLEGGQDWLDVINEAVGVCQRMILCVTPESLGSHYVKIEYRAFISEQKLLVPLVCREAKMPVELRVLQHLPYDDFEGLVRTLRGD